MENKKVRKPNQVVIEELMKYFKKKNIKIYSEKSFFEDDENTKDKK